MSNVFKVAQIGSGRARTQAVQSGSSVCSDPALKVSRVCGASEMEDVIQSFKVVVFDVPQVGARC